MLRLLTSIVLFLVAQAAGAQCVDTTPLGTQIHSGASLIRTSATSGVAPRPQAAGGELIKTAAGGPREAAMRQSPSVSGPKQEAADDEEPRGTGPAMMIAALAVMTAIALRRSGRSSQ